jgi:hypothetical protein
MIVFLNLAALEGAAFVLARRHRSLFRQPAIPLNQKDAEAFLSGPTFDPDLGWDAHPRARNDPPLETLWAQSYGDSFTYGWEVPESETWQAQFHQLTGKSIVNYGVGGYGLDQAVLKFEKFGGQRPTPVAILALYAHEYRRLLSYESRYYFPDSPEFVYAFKPIFVLDETGFVLRKPPRHLSHCLYEALSNPGPALREFLTAHDHWYLIESAKPPLRFPFTWNVARAVPEMLAATRTAGKSRDYFFVTPRAFDLTRFLIRRFVTACAERNAIPLCLMILGPYDLAQIERGQPRWDLPVRDFLEAERIWHIDAGQYLLDLKLDAAGYQALRAPDGHFNALGNRRIAEALKKGVDERSGGRLTQNH